MKFEFIDDNNNFKIIYVYVMITHCYSNYLLSNRYKDTF